MLEVDSKISLTKFSEKDIPNMITYLNDQEMYKNTLRIPFPYGEQDAKNRLQAIHDFEEKHGFQKDFAIRNEDQELIGGISMHFINGLDSHSAEIGYWLGKPYWGKGSMSKVVTKFSDFAIKEFNLLRLSGIVFHFNEASAKLLLNSGFEYEGYLKNHDFKDGEGIDVKLFSKVI